MNRMNICAPRPKKDGTTYWHKIGTAFPAKSGDGWNLVFDSLPLPDAEGRCAASLFPQRDRQDGQGSQGSYGGGQQGYGQTDDMDDEIPF